jgi:hypothetical protein
MKRINTLLALAGAAVLGMSTGQLSAQQDRGGGRGNFDPEQMRQRMMERYREQLEVKNDDEWKLIEVRVEKVMEARRDLGRAGFGGPGAFGFGGRRPQGGDGGEGRRGGGGGGGDQQGRRGFGGEPNPDAEALQKAIEAKAPADELKAKMATYRESRKASQAKLETAQAELRKVLTVRQEATSMMMGLLD